MDRELTLALGKILGETIRLQKRVDPEMVQISDSIIYGLLNGFESVIEQQLTVNDPVTADDINAMADILNPYHIDREALNSFRGYYDIEGQITERGISRIKAIDILTYFKVNGQFEEVINRMNTSNSPGECRRFNIHENEV